MEGQLDPSEYLLFRIENIEEIVVYAFSTKKLIDGQIGM